MPPPDYEYIPQPPQTVRVSLTFTGTDSVDRAATHGTVCGDGERECQSIRIYAQRPATGTLTFGELTGSGDGMLAYVSTWTPRSLRSRCRPE